jgi:hypothetical protein
MYYPENGLVQEYAVVLENLTRMFSLWKIGISGYQSIVFFFFLNEVNA